MKYTLSSLALLALLVGGIPACITITQGPAQEAEPPKPDPFEGDTPPQLEPTKEPGWFTAHSLDPTLYYSEESDLWYRFAYNRWYLAYRWNGAWWIPPETPPFLLTQVKIVEDRTDLKTRLEEQEKRLKELDKQEQEDGEPADQPEPSAAPNPAPAPASSSKPKVSPKAQPKK